MNKADVFSRIYRENHWASAETRSGVGSEMGRTQSVRERLPWLFDVLGAKSVLDAGCGDLNWMQHVEAQVEYVGVDIVPELVATLEREHAGDGRRFDCLDITLDILPPCDLIICRTVLFHLTLTDAQNALDNFRACGASWLLATTYPWHFPNVDIVTGGWRRMNLQAEPFCLPWPWLLLPEDELDPNAPFNPGYLGLWRLGSDIDGLS